MHNSRFEIAIIIITYDYDPLEPDEYQHFFSEFDHIFFAASPLSAFGRSVRFRYET